MPPEPAIAPTAPADSSDAAAEAFFSGAAPAEQAPIPPKAEPAKAEPAKKEPAAVEPKKSVSVFDTAKTKVDPKAEPAAGTKAEPAIDRFPEPEKMSETGKAGWKSLKEAEAASRNEAANLRAQLETYKKASPAESSDYAKLKADHQAALDRLAVLDIESHPDFVNQYVKPKDEAIAKASEVLSWNEVTGVDVGQLLAKAPKDFNASLAEITKSMNPVDAAQVISELRTAHKLANGAKSALTNSSQLRQQLQERSAAQQKQEFENVFKEISYGEGFFEPQIPEDASPEDRAEFAEISAAMKGAKVEAEKYAFGKLSPKDAAKLAAKAAFLDVHINKVVPRMHKEWSKVSAENVALREENASLKKAKNPGSFSGDKAVAAANDGAPADFSDAAAEKFFSQNR